MLNLKHRSHEKELLDGDNIPYHDVILNMKELNTINTYLGGHNITIEGFRKICGSQKNVSLAEIGCGGGDNLRAVEHYCFKNNISLHCMGIDKNFDIATYAMEQNKKMSIVSGDYRQVNFKQKPYIIFSSLFCHHFSESELVEQILWMKENSQLGFFINDLQRNSIAYYAIKILTSLFSKSYLVKNDAPLSVARGFKRREWKSIFAKAGIQNYTIQWKWAFRYLICYKHEQ